MFTAEGGPMAKLVTILLAVLFSSVQAQPPAGKTIEGYWQDTARRILFAAEASASYVYGAWTTLDLQQTYPSAKHIRRSANGFELIDLLYDEEHVISVAKASRD